jgi:hypothetical protein
MGDCVFFLFVWQGLLGTFGFHGERLFSLGYAAMQSIFAVFVSLMGGGIGVEFS